MVGFLGSNRRGRGTVALIHGGLSPRLQVAPRHGWLQFLALASDRDRAYRYLYCADVSLPLRSSSLAIRSNSGSIRATQSTTCTSLWLYVPAVICKTNGALDDRFVSTVVAVMAVLYHFGTPRFHGWKCALPGGGYGHADLVLQPRLLLWLVCHRVSRAYMVDVWVSGGEPFFRDPGLRLYAASPSLEASLIGAEFNRRADVSEGDASSAAQASEHHTEVEMVSTVVD